MMNNKQLDDVSRTNEGESIEKMLLRLNSERTGGVVDCNEGDFSFEVVCELLELARAEEREACKDACRKLAAQGANIPGEFWQGYNVGADACFTEIDRRGQK